MPIFSFSTISLKYFSLFDYIAWGNSVLADNCKVHKARVKAGRKDHIEKLLNRLATVEDERKDRFFNEHVSLVPIPRSSLLSENAVWPSLVIASVLLERGYAYQVIKALERVHPLGKTSSKYSADDRYSVDDHYKSMRAKEVLNATDEIVLVDDFVTQGRTAYASYLRIHETYPKAHVRLFSLFGTYSFRDDDEEEKTTLFNPVFSRITYNDGTGKTWRHVD